MSVGTFTDKQHCPTLEEVWAAIGPQRTAWEALTQFVQENYASQADCRFYGKNYGWAWRLRKGSKALLSLYPAQEGFVVQVVLNESDTRQALALNLGRHVRQILEEARPYPEGRWLFIPIKTAKDIKDIQHLLNLKAPVKARK